jgi:hypothetical protein
MTTKMKVKKFFFDLWRGLKALFKAAAMLRYRGRFDDLRCYRCCYRKSGNPKKLEYCRKQWKGNKRTCERFRFDKTSLHERIHIFNS